MEKDSLSRWIVLFLVGCLSMGLALWCLTQATGWLTYATWPLAAVGGGCQSRSLVGLYRFFQAQDHA
jgi:hypothetical protein